MAEFKAYTYSNPGYPSCIALSTLSSPQTLSPTQIQVRVNAAALNPVDIQLMNSPLFSLPLLNGPKGIGSDFCGTVLKAGAQSGFKENDEVFGLMFTPGKLGTVAEILTVDVTSCPVLKKPDGWSSAQGAALPLVWLTARTCIAHAEPYIGTTMKTIAVLGGSSATGMYVIHLAKQRGWNVISTCSGKNTDFVKSMGADQVIDYTSENVPERIRAAKPDVIVDCVGGIECLGIANRYITIVGDKTSRSTMGGSALYWTHPSMLMRWFWGRIGWGEAYDAIALEGKNEYLEEALELPAKKIVIDSTFPFEQLKEGFERLNTGRARGKVVINIGG
jgi:NADPH:quinone reductase-like Zn-dependent oxidoreductase